MRFQWQIAGRNDTDHEEVQAFSSASSYLSMFLIWGEIQLNVVRVTRGQTTMQVRASQVPNCGVV